MWTIVYVSHNSQCWDIVFKNMNLLILFSLFLHSFDRDSCIVSIVFTVLSSASLDLMLELKPASSESLLWEEDMVLLSACLVPLGPPPAPSLPSCNQECPESFSTWSSVIAVTLPIIISSKLCRQFTWPCNSIQLLSHKSCSFLCHHWWCLC